MVVVGILRADADDAELLGIDRSSSLVHATLELDFDTDIDVSLDGGASVRLHPPPRQPAPVVAQRLWGIEGAMIKETGSLDVERAVLILAYSNR